MEEVRRAEEEERVKEGKFATGSHENIRLTSRTTA